MSAKHIVGNLVISAMPGWLDVTHEIEADNPPFTLARNDGVGALQFSTATYERGEIPTVTIEHLKTLMADFASSRELGAGFDARASEQPMLICGRSFNSGTQFVRAWYCSNGRDVALITYVSEKGIEAREIPDCERMISELRFTPASPQLLSAT
jgi:hypothetical protein